MYSSIQMDSSGFLDVKGNTVGLSVAIKGPYKSSKCYSKY